MKYSKEVYEKTKSVLDSRRIKAETDAEKRRGEFAKVHPELLVIEDELTKTGLEAVKAVIGGSGDVKKTVEELMKTNLQLQKDRENLLLSAGVDKNYLKPHYTCEICKDKGYTDGKICSCRTELLKKFASEELSYKTPLKLSSFEDFSLSYYPTEKYGNGISPRERMKGVYEFCREYAADFSTESPNLFMYGETGLGKTHLSLAIANEVIKKGFSVVYDSAQNLFTRLEKERFGREGGNTEDTVLYCDLLILDDLGAEFDTKYVLSEIYNIINSRISYGRPTVISSNAALDELTGLYGARVTSRIIGDYELILFEGRDVRQIKKRLSK